MLSHETNFRQFLEVLLGERRKGDNEKDRLGAAGDVRRAGEGEGEVARVRVAHVGAAVEDEQRHAQRHAQKWQMAPISAVFFRPELLSARKTSSGHILVVIFACTNNSSSGHSLVE